ncbi:MAG: hypothetical protein ACOY93_08520 [Bacillota bacterium]
MKQMGAVWARTHLGPIKGDDPEFWSEDLRIREWPEVAAKGATA